MDHVFREYRKEQDLEAVRRIWMEIGWIDKDQTEVVDLMVEAGRTLVAEVNGAAECMVMTAPGSLRYLQEDLPFFGVTGVATSRIARKQGLASRLTARAVAAGAGDGALVGGLSMFEQGYYNQIGFGTGSYERWIGFDPARLRIPVQPRVPERLSGEDWAAIHAARLARLRGHGACSLYPAAITRSEFTWMKNAFGMLSMVESWMPFKHIWTESIDPQKMPMWKDTGSKRSAKMPIYEYRCKKCGATSEFLTGLGSDDAISCKNCGSPEMEKMMSVPSFIARTIEAAAGHTCCGREERCEKLPCSDGGACRRD